MNQKKILSLIGIGGTILSLLMPADVGIGKILSLYIAIVVLYPLVRSLKSGDYHITILCAFMFSYVSIPINYYWLDLHINYYNECESPSTVYKVLQILVLFHSILLFKLKFSKSSEANHILFSEKNDIVFYIMAIMSFMFITFGSTGEDIFEAGGYSNALQTKSSSLLFAYSLIPISLSYIYANDKTQKIIAYSLIGYFCVKDLLFGGRVDSLQLLLIIFVLRLQYIWSKKTIIIAAAVGALFFLSWGILRSDINLGLVGAISEQLSSLFGERNVDFQTGNSAEVYYSSVRIIYLIEHDFLTWGMRLQSLAYFCLSSVVPYSALPELANLSAYLQTTYWSGGGGLGPVFFYAFAGWIGVIVFALFIAWCVNLLTTKNSSKYVYFYAVLLLATTPRWYAYYPTQIIKFCVVGALLYFFMNVFVGKTKHSLR